MIQGSCVLKHILWFMKRFLDSLKGSRIAVKVLRFLKKNYRVPEKVLAFFQVLQETGGC